MFSEMYVMKKCNVEGMDGRIDGWVEKEERNGVQFARTA